MKTIICFLQFLSVLVVSAQTPKMNFDLARKVIDPTLQDQYVPVMIQGEIAKISTAIRSIGGRFKASAGDIASVNVQIKDLLFLADKSFVKRIESYNPHLVMLNDSMRIKANVDAVHSGLSPLPQGYDGSGVIIGFIDSGIDLAHPDFKDANGKTRIMHIWDHKNIANTSIYGYGQEWDSTSINNGTCTENDQQGNGHGTASSGTAAGNGNSLIQFQGVAPKADIITVALNFANQHANQSADGIDFIFKKADLLGKPCVINVSEGNYFGSHDGKDLEAQFIKNLIIAKPGRMIVASAGNAGGQFIHEGHNVSATDTNFTWFKYAGGDTYMAVYGDSASFVNIKFGIGQDLVSPNYSLRGKTPLTAIGAMPFQSLIVQYLKNGNNDTLAQVLSYLDKTNGVYIFEYLILPDSIPTNYRWRLMTTGTGRMDTWSSNMVSTGLPTTTVFPDIAKYIKPDSTQNIVTGLQCLNEVLTVGNYCNKRYYTNVDGELDTTYNIYTSDKIMPTSSIGPTRDGRIKPDISAPGDRTITAMDLSIAAIWMGQPSNRKKLALGGQHTRAGGTSIAGPVVSGVAALYMQKNPTATAAQIKNDILACALNDSYTGTTPNNQYGYGKVNAFGALAGCASSINTLEKKSEFEIYPNPFNEQTTIQYNFSSTKNFNSAQLRIYDITGKLVRTIDLKEKQNTTQLHKNDLRSGSYFYNLLINDNIIKSNKLIVL